MGQGQSKNMTAVLFKNKVKDCSIPKSISQKSAAEFLVRADYQHPGLPIDKNVGVSKNLNDSLI